MAEDRPRCAFPHGHFGRMMEMVGTLIQDRAPSAVAGRPAVHRAAIAAGTAGDVAADATRPEVALLPADLIGGDESVIFAIKPSLWFIAFDSAGWILTALVLIIGASWFADMIPAVSESQFMTVVLTGVSLRICIALLRWVSRFYVLTNRRVMRIRGVRKADVFECPLVNIRNTAVDVSFHEALAKLGTLSFAICDRPDHHAAWRNIAHPREVHAEVRKAIQRALDRQPPRI